MLNRSKNVHFFQPYYFVSIEAILFDVNVSLDEVGYMFIRC